MGDTVTTPEGVRGEVSSLNVLRQTVKVLVNVNDEKELREYSVDELKFRPRHKKVKVSQEEIKALADLEK